MNRGEVYEYVIGGQRARIAIVSATAYNPRLAIFAVIRHPTAKPPPTSIAVPTGAGDPVVGTVDVSRLRVLDESAVRARLGRLTPDTLGRVSRALRTYLDL